MKKDERRKQIIDAAMTVFIEKGFSGSTTLEIAKAAKISEVTLFRYFISKQEVFLEGIKPILFTSLEVSINSSHELTPQAKLEHILYERISFITKNYQIVKLILKEASLLEELGSENFMEKILLIFKTMLKQMGIKNEEFTLRILMGAILSFLYMPDKNEEKIKAYVKKIASLIIKEANIYEQDI